MTTNPRFSSTFIVEAKHLDTEIHDSASSMQH